MNTHTITVKSRETAQKMYHYYSKQGYELIALSDNEYRMQRIFDRVAQMLIIVIEK